MANAFRIKELRKFSKKDLDGLNNLFSEWWAKKRYKVKSIKPKYFKQFIKNSRLICLYDNEKIIGAVTVTKIYKISGLNCSIEHLIIDKNYRGRGLSKQLMKFAIDLAKKQSAKRIFLTCDKNNAIGNTLYKKMGFKLGKVNFYSLGL